MSGKLRHCWHTRSGLSAWQTGCTWLFGPAVNLVIYYVIGSLLRFKILWVVIIVDSQLDTIVSCIRHHFLALSSSCCHLSIFEGCYLSVCTSETPCCPCHTHASYPSVPLAETPQASNTTELEQLLLPLSWCALILRKGLWIQCLVHYFPPILTDAMTDKQLRFFFFSPPE